MLVLHSTLRTKALRKYGLTASIAPTSTTRALEAGKWSPIKPELVFSLRIQSRCQTSKWKGQIKGPQSETKQLYVFTREVKVYLHCDRSLQTGSEKITAIGDSQMRLSYVS